MDDEEVLSGGSTHLGCVVRVGDTVRRPRTEGAELVEAFLVHLEQVGFDSAPRFRGDVPVALLDWDFVMPGDELYDVVTLLFSARNPRPDRAGEFEDRSNSARSTLAAVLDGYGADDGQRDRATRVAAAMCVGAADFLVDLGPERSGAHTVAEFEEEILRRRFLADWWTQQSG